MSGMWSQSKCYQYCMPYWLFLVTWLSVFTCTIVVFCFMWGVIISFQKLAGGDYFFRTMNTSSTFCWQFFKLEVHLEHKTSTRPKVQSSVVCKSIFLLVHELNPRQNLTRFCRFCNRLPCFTKVKPDPFGNPADKNISLKIEPPMEAVRKDKYFYIVALL